MGANGMEPVVQSLLAGLPVLLLHLGLSLLILFAALLIYMALTPHNELRLIRDGNRSAAVSLGGAALGLAIPMAASLSASINGWDVVIWGVVILAIQVLLFKLADLVLKDLPRRIERDEMPAALLLAALKVAVALLVAAAVAG